uniref:Uncharacterized protein n=1 Tax=Rhizophora mucronata TaxID=61149 RepID=A0A2P2NVK8_RHIMU
MIHLIKFVLSRFCLRFVLLVQYHVKDFYDVRFENWYI